MTDVRQTEEPRNSLDVDTQPQEKMLCLNGVHDTSQASQASKITKASNVPDGDSLVIRSALDDLSALLVDANLPALQDRRDTPRTDSNGNQIAIVVLLPPKDCLALLIEGARQCPGSVLLVLSPDWLSLEQRPENPDGDVLLVHTAVTWDVGGATFLDAFQPPRTATYVIGNRTVQDMCQACNPAALHCKRFSPALPGSLGHGLLHRRHFLGSVGLPSLPTLSFTRGGGSTLPSNSKVVTVVRLLPGVTQESLIQSEYEKWKSSSHLNDASKVSVRAMSTHDRGISSDSSCVVSDTESVVRSVTSLLASLAAEDCVLVEPLYSLPSSTPRADGQVSLRQRSLWAQTSVFRRLGRDVVNTAMVLGGLCDADRAWTRGSDVPVTLDSALGQAGLEDGALRREAALHVQDVSQATLHAVLDLALSTAEDEPSVTSACDVLAVDCLMRPDDKGGFQPVIADFDVNLCTASQQSFLLCNPRHPDNTLAPVFLTLLQKSLKAMFSGKRILLLCLGSKKSIIGSMLDWNVKIHLVHNKAEHWAEDLVEEVVSYDFNDHSQDVQHAHNLAAMFADRKLDGVVTFWESCTILTSMVGQRLGLPTTSLEGIINAKSKARTHEVLLASSGANHPLGPRVANLASPSLSVSTRSELLAALQSRQLAFPLVIKPKSAASSFGARRIDSVEEALAHFDMLLEAAPEDRRVTQGYGFGLVVMELLEGPQFSVDVVLCERRLVLGLVTQKGPYHLPHFKEGATSCPSHLSDDENRQIVSAAYWCCRGIGLDTGVFNLDMRVTSLGPRLIEINGRMTGSDHRSFYATTHSVDLLTFNLALTLGIKFPAGEITARPQRHLLAFSLYPYLHRQLLLTSASLERQEALKEQGELELYRNVTRPEVLEREPRPSDVIFTTLHVHASTRERVREKFQRVWQLLGLDTVENLQHHLSLFKTRQTPQD